MWACNEPVNERRILSIALPWIPGGTRYNNNNGHQKEKKEAVRSLRQCRINPIAILQCPEADLIDSIYSPPPITQGALHTHRCLILSNKTLHPNTITMMKSPEFPQGTMVPSSKLFRFSILLVCFCFGLFQQSASYPHRAILPAVRVHCPRLPRFVERTNDQFGTADSGNVFCFRFPIYPYKIKLYPYIKVWTFPAGTARVVGKLWIACNCSTE